MRTAPDRTAIRRIAIRLTLLAILLAAGFTLLPVIAVHVTGNGITLDGATIGLMVVMFAYKLVMLLAVLALVCGLIWWLTRGGPWTKTSILSSFLGLIAMASLWYYERESARTADYSDPYRYIRMARLGIPVEYENEPAIAWKVVPWQTKIDLTDRGRALTCVEDYLTFNHPFESGHHPETIGEAITHCRRQAR